MNIYRMRTFDTFYVWESFGDKKKHWQAHDSACVLFLEFSLANWLLELKLFDFFFWISAQYLALKTLLSYHEWFEIPILYFAQFWENIPLFTLIIFSTKRNFKLLVVTLLTERRTLGKQWRLLTVLDMRMTILVDTWHLFDIFG